MSMTMTAEIREELAAMIRQELQEQRTNKSAYQRAWEGFSDELSSFNYVKDERIRNSEGEIREFHFPRKCSQKVKSAIGTLIRAVFEVDTVSQLPADKEPEMKEFMRKVLEMMRDFKKQTV